MRKALYMVLSAAFAAELLAAAGGSVERVEKLGLDDVEITAVERIEPGTEIGGTKAAGGAVLVKARAKPPSKVNIAICLPDDWNGIFLGNGNGGMGQNLSLKAAVGGANGGYASAHCDLGTDKWWVDQESLDVAAADFGHDAVCMMTRAGKKIAEAYYGRKPEHSYYVGGSTGGQEGLSMAERDPGEYDGIAVFYPVSDRTGLHTRFIFERALLHPGNRFSDEQIKKITEKIVAQNRGNGGEPADPQKPYLKYPERAKVDYSKFDFLTKEQIEILKKVHSPFLDPKTGAFVTFGLPPSCEIADNGKSLKGGFVDWMSEWFFRKSGVDASKVDLHSYARDFGKRFAAANAAPNLGKFRKLGGKLLIVQGKIDTIVPADYIREWYGLLCENVGSVPKTAEFARLFMVPGGWHGNISGVDMLGTIRKWVETGTPPEQIKASVIINNKRYPEDAELYLPR